MSAHSALVAISGRVRLESEDPCWVLNDLELLLVKGEEKWWEEVCLSMIKNNIYTRNMLTLIDKTKHLLRQVLIQKGKHIPCSRKSVELCCISIHVLTLFVHYFVRTLSDDEMEDHMMCSETDGVYQKLLEEIGELFHVTATSDSGIDSKTHDILYFSVTFLLASLSSQLYDSFNYDHHQNPHSRHRPSHALLRSLYFVAESQMLRAFTFSTSSGCGVSNSAVFPPRATRDSSAGGHVHPFTNDPTETLPSKILKGLLKIVSPSSFDISNANIAPVKGKKAVNRSDHETCYEVDIPKDSLANYKDRLLLKHMTSERETSISRDGAQLVVPQQQWNPLDILSYSLKFLQKLYSRGGTTDIDGAAGKRPKSVLPQYFFNSTSGHVIMHEETTATITANFKLLALSDVHILTAPLAERSLGLLNLLLQNRKGAATITAHHHPIKNNGGRINTNPFQQSLALLYDAHVAANFSDTGHNNGRLDLEISEDQFSNDWDLEGGGKDMSSCVQSSTSRRGIHINFSSLTNALQTRLVLSSPSTLLLLYTMLHTHPTYLPVLLANGNAKTLLISLLKTLYDAINRISTASKEQEKGIGLDLPSPVPSLESLYLVVINVLLIIQDDKLRPSMSKIFTSGEDLTWYKEKDISEVSLSDLTLLCTIRAAMTTLQHLHDSYLLTNLLAILLDLAPFMQLISPYCCERVIVLTYRLCRKYHQYCCDNTIGSNGPHAENMGECIKVLMVLIATTVRDSGKQLSNIHMLYTLARKYNDISSHESFSSKYVTALFTTVLLASSDALVLDANRANNQDVVPPESAVVSNRVISPPIPPPLSRSSSATPVPPIARNSSDSDSLATQVKSSQASSAGNTIPPNIHIIRVSQRGLHLLQQQDEHRNVAENGARWEMVDSEAEIVPNTAAKALELLKGRLTKLQPNPNRGSGEDGYAIVPMDFGRFVMYTYEEGESPEEFFVPFAWEIAVNMMTNEFSWKRDEVALI